MNGAADYIINYNDRASKHLSERSTIISGEGRGGREESRWGETINFNETWSGCNSFCSDDAANDWMGDYIKFSERQLKTL